MNVDFSNAKVLIIGDVMLDKYYMGSVDRISPEAPVPVVSITKEESRLGGAANVANNISSLGGEVVLVGVVGYDFFGKEVERLTKSAGIQSTLFKGNNPTITKARIIGGKQQIARLDYEEYLDIDDHLFEQLAQTIEEQLVDADIVVISDYGKGLISPDIAQMIINECQVKNKKVIVDPKGSDWSKYRGATYITPNVKEVSDILGYKVLNEDETIEKSTRELLDKYNLNALLVTRSEKGMSYVAQYMTHHIPTFAQEVFDVSGAGDTVVATLACALAKGYAVDEAIHLANTAAGVVVKKVGTATLSVEELNDEL